MTESPAPATLPPGYPAGLERTWQPAGGPPILIRPMRPDDLDREMRFIHGLSKQTLYERMQYNVREVSPATAARLLQIDYRDTFACAALVDEPGGDEIVGVARYARIEQGDRAECAIVVTDAWQGRGVGTELMRTLARAARGNGIVALVGEVLGGNQRLAAWARRFGCEATTVRNSGGLLQVTLALTDLPA